MRHTIEQERANFCLEKTYSILKKGGDKQKFKRNAMRLPQLIVNNGLVPTLAFYKSKKEAVDVFTALNEWLNSKFKFGNSKDALDYCLKADFQKLRLATVEALALAEWLKRIVEAEIKDEGD